MSEPILIVTPVWKDSTRLARYGPTLAKAFAESELTLRWVIADDGSGEDEIKALKEQLEQYRQTFPNVHLHLADGHRGKGSIIREAWDADSESHWLAFVDADGSITAEDMLKLVSEAVHQKESVIGIRKRTKETQISESPYRWIFHHGYLLVVHLLLGLRCEDLQCGSKIFKADDYRRISASLKEPGFPFDTELLAALNENGFRWLEIPINWTEMGGGTVRPMRVAWHMFKAVLRIRKRHR